MTHAELIELIAQLPGWELIAEGTADVRGICRLPMAYPAFCS